MMVIERSLIYPIVSFRCNSTRDVWRCRVQEMAVYKSSGKKPAAKAPPKPAAKPVEEDDDDDDEDEEEDEESD